MTKILVADDEADLETLIRQKFRQKIREDQYQFVFAVNGNDALKKMQEHPDVSVILTDINMPEMDGLTLLGKLNETAPMTKTVMVSAYGDMDNIRTAMNRRDLRTNSFAGLKTRFSTMLDSMCLLIGKGIGDWKK